MGKMIGFVCVFLLQLVALQTSADLALEHSFFAALDEDQNVNLYWNVSAEEKDIYFTVEAKTTGWIGFGISSGQGKMEGADIVIGWVKDGKAYFKVSKHILAKWPSQNVNAPFLEAFKQLPQTFNGIVIVIILIFSFLINGA